MGVGKGSRDAGAVAGVRAGDGVHLVEEFHDIAVGESRAGLEGMAQPCVEEEADVLEHLHSEAQAAGARVSLRKIEQGAELAQELLLVVLEAVNGYGFERTDVKPGSDIGVES